MSEWSNYPERSGAAWVRFRRDPRADTKLRVPDSERDITREVLAEAYADGQLDHDEYLSRLDLAGSAVRYGDLVPLVDDVTVGLEPRTIDHGGTPDPVRQTDSSARPRPAQEQSTARSKATAQLVASGSTWLLVTLITNAVWAVTSLSGGRALYYWPMWPMLGMTILVVVTLLGTMSQPPGSGKSGDSQNRCRPDRDR